MLFVYDTKQQKKIVPKTSGVLVKCSSKGFSETFGPVSPECIDRWEDNMGQACGDDERLLPLLSPSSSCSSSSTLSRNALSSVG